MNRRIRKKKHLGEFDYKGFEVRCNFDQKLDQVAAGAFMDSCILLAEANNLTVGGSYGSEDADFVVTRVLSNRPGDKRRRGYTHCTQEDRELVGDYLKAQPFMGDIHIGALKGVWHHL